MEKVEWKTRANQTLAAEVELITEKTVNLDGDKMQVPCCEIEITYYLDGEYIDSGRPYKAPKNDIGVAYSTGKIGMTEETYQLVKSAIDKAESHPLWVEKQEQIKKNREEIEKMEKQRIANGWCPKCGSYCYRDCEAN